MIDAVIAQHVEDAGLLGALRLSQVSAPHIKLEHLARLDERIAAHVDGMVIAGDRGWRLCEEALEQGGAGAVFAATVAAIHSRNAARFDQVCALAEAVPGSRDGFLGAFGWVSNEQLRDLGRNLLGATSPFRRFTAIAACSMHRVDPGAVLAQAFESTDALLRARALRAAGELHKSALLPACVSSAVNDPDASCRFWAAWSAVLLGDRVRAPEALIDLYQTSPTHAARALELLVLALDPRQGSALVNQTVSHAKQPVAFVRACGLIGDLAHIPWLIEQMSDVRVARVAGESFSMLTAADLAEIDLDRAAPEEADAGPTDDPEDENVEMDPDAELPWPDAERVARWWQQNGNAFPADKRTFMGGPITRDRCMAVLRNGYQRQRRVAALHLALRSTGDDGPLFEWRAPAWRQKRKLS